MQKEISVFEELKNLVVKTDSVLTKNEKVDLKQDLISFIGLFNKVIDIFNYEVINDLKNNKKSLFLLYLVNLKELLEKLLNYFSTIESEIKTFYTEELVEEIKLLENKVNTLNKDLEYDKIYLNLEKKEKIDFEFKNINLLLNQRDEIKRKYIAVKSYNVNDLTSEIENLESEVIKENKNINTLLTQKNKLQKKLDDILNIKEELKSVNDKTKEEDSNLLNQIEIYLNNKKDKTFNWDTEKSRIRENLKLETEKLNSLEYDIKENLKELSYKKEIYLKYKNLLNERFLINENFKNSYSGIKNNIESKLKNIEEQLNSLDSDINILINIEQNILDELSKNPYKIDNI
jgi:chromosome segregation ATPase